MNQNFKLNTNYCEHMVDFFFKMGTINYTDGNINSAAVISDEPSQADGVPLDIQETVSLKDRLAMYQAAVSKKESSSSSVAAPEEEARALPGGLASVKKQFESQEIASSHNTAAHYRYHKQSVQDVTSTSEVKENSHTRKTDEGNGPPPTTEQLLSYQMETVSVIEQNTHQSSMEGNFENHFNDFNVDVMTDDEKPKVSTQMLKQQFEKSAQPTQMATNTTKQIKTEHKFQEMQWPPVVSTSNISTTAGKIFEATSLRKIDSTAASVSVSSSNRGSMEEFPPPPPDLLNTPSEITYFSQSPEPSLSSTKQVIPKELYSKQRNLYELKRLYKHINPEVRKNLEKEFIQEISEIVTNETKDNDVMGDVQQAKYVFEHTGHSPQKCVSPEREYLEWDEILKGEVQSMRWMFETQPLDSIKDESPDQSNAKCISQQEMISGGDVKYTTWMFETQAIDTLGVSSPESTEATGKIPELARGDVRTATWLFETQALDSMNKIYQEGDQSIETSTTKDITAGDVKTARYLFETQSLDTLGHLDSVDEMNFLHLKSEVEEIKGNVKKTTKLFETQPLYVIRDQSGQVLEIKTVKREEIEKGDVRTALWLFETKPLDVINKDVSSIKVVCGISREEANQGGVNRAKWLFETHPLDSIKEQLETDTSVNYKEEIQGADVSRQCWMFETQPFDSLKDNDNARPIETEEIIGGDVRSTRHLFETVPMDALKDSTDIGKLKCMIASEEEKGDVRHQTWIFETQPLEMIGEEKEKYTKTIQLEEIKKGDVSNYRQVFETMNLSHIDESKKIQVDGVTSGAVMSNRTLFETTPLYAVQDSAGHYHEVKTVRREEIVRGDVRTCRWMFETTPIDQFDESIQKFQIIKGISKEEIQSGDVKTAKWLFETQPLDAIKYFSNVEDEEIVTKQCDDVKGDVQTCRWLFETQPMDALYEKVDIKNEVDEIQKGDVRTCTWLFETQPLDAIKDNSETIVTMRTVQREDIQGSDVRMACFLFETESLGNIEGEKKEEFRQITEIDIQSGDVSRKKWIFENKSLDLINSSSEEELKKIRSMTAEDIQKGNVINCTWLFENHPIDAIKENSEEREILRTITDVQGGDVGKGRFIFETYSLDQIKEESSETTDLKKFSMEQIEKGDVKNYTMLFETQPLYAIKDKEGYYHEVTTVRKEEVVSGDVRGTRWLFETKPLDLIKETDEVYVIKAVTQEDIQKGDVTSARWRFETQPLDKIADHEKVILKTVCDVQGGDVRSSTQLFESDLDQKYVRTVSVSEIQHGNVRTATWLFESHTIDEIKGEDSEYKKIETVGREDVQKGDVKQAIWLFEKQPLDSIKEINDTNIKILQEDIPQVDVKTTTWLFETTPLHQFNESPVERPEIMGKNIEETLKSLYDYKILQSQGILIEANEVGDVRMAKYQLLNQTSPEIQKEQVVRGDLQKIMMELLSKKESAEKGITVDHNEKGNIHLTTAQLLKRTTDINVEKEEIIGCDIRQVINNLLSHDNSAKKGILIQESEKGDVRMTVYSLLNRTDDTKVQQDEVLKGDIQAAIDKLIATSQSSELSQKVKVNDIEKGNVQFYTTCIESGALDYLKLLQQETDETAVVQQESEEIIRGDVEGAKQMLKQQQMQIGRTVAESEILSGDVQNAVLTFMAERQNISANVEKEEIIRGDLRIALDSLSQAINQPTLVKKEHVVRGNLSATLKSLEEAKSHKKYIEKPEVIPGDIKGTLDSLERSVNTRVEVDEEGVVLGDLQCTSTCLEEAQSKMKQVEKNIIMRADLQASMGNLLETASEKKVLPCGMSNKGDVKATIQNLMEPPQQQVQPQASGEGAVQNTIKIHQDGQKQLPITKNIGHKGGAHGSIKSFLAAQEQGKMDITKNVNTIIRTKLNAEQQEGTKKVNVKADDSVKWDIQEKAQSLLPPDKQHQYNMYEVVKEDVKKISDEHSTGITPKHIGAQSVQSTRIKSTADKYNTHKVKETFGSVDRKIAKQQVSVSTDGQSSFQSPRTSEFIKIPNIEICTGADTIVAQVMNSQTIQGSSILQENAQVSKQTVQTFASQSIMEHDVKSKQETKSIKELHKTVDDRSQIINKGLAPKIKSGTTSLEKSRMSTNKMDIKAQNPRKNELSQGKMNKKNIPEVQFSIPPPPPPPTLLSSETELLLPPPPPSHIEEDNQMLPLPPPPPPLVQIKSEIYETELPPSPLPPPPPPPITTTRTLVQEKFTAGYLPPPPLQSELNLLPLPPPLPQSPFQQRKLVNKASKFQSLPKMSNFESIKPKEQPKKKVPYTPLISKPNVITAEDSTSSKVDIQQQKHEPTQEKQHEPVQPSTCPQTIHSSPPQSVIRPGQKLLKQKEAQAPPAVNKVFVPPGPSTKTETAKLQPRSYARKFKTPLMIAEEKYRKEREEMEKNKAAKMAWLVNMGEPVTEVSKRPDKGGCKNSFTVKPSVLPTVTSAADHLTFPASQVTETENMPIVAKHQIYPKPRMPTAEEHPVYPKPAASTASEHQGYLKPKVSTAEEHPVYPKPAVSASVGHQEYRKSAVSTAVGHQEYPKSAVSTAVGHQEYPKSAVSTAVGHQEYPKSAVSASVGHQEYPKPAVSTAVGHQEYPKPEVSTAVEHQDYPKPIVSTASEDQMSTKTVSSSLSAVVSASEQLHRILKYSSDVMSNKEEIVNAFKDSVKDIGLESIKQHKELYKKGQEQPSHLKPQSVSLPKFKVKTIQLPKDGQIMQEKKENSLSYKKQQKQISKPEENKSQEKTAIKQFQLKQNDHVDVTKQEQHNIVVQQHNQVHLGEYYQSATEVKDQNIEKTSVSQALTTNMAQDQVKNMKEVQQHNQQSYTAHSEETQKVQQKKEKGGIYKEAKSEKMQKHHVKAQKEAFPKFQGEQDQQKNDLAIQVMNQKTSDKQAHVQKHLDWKEMVISENQAEYKTEQESFQAKEEQVCYIRNASSKHGLVPAHVENIKQENKESRNTAVQQKKIDKGEARPYVEISDSYRKREELQHILFRLIQFEKENDNIDFNALKAFLEKVPKWLTDGQGFPMKVTKGNDLQKVKKELTQIKQKALLKLAYFDESIQKALISMSGLKPEKEMFCCTTPSQKISKISIGSSKLDKQGRSNVEEQACESKKEQLSEIRLAESRAQSPAKRMPSPSPSYITIESTARRTESPLRTVPSPPLSQKAYSTPSPVQRETTPTPPLPLRSSEMPTSRIRTSSTSPSPPRGKRYDQLAKLKDTTAKLSQGISPSTQFTHPQIAEKRSEIIPSPATLRRQLKIDTPVTDMLPKPESPTTSVTVKDITEMFEEARRSEENKVYMRKDPIDIPERLGSDTEESESAVSKQNVQMPKVDLSELVHKFEMPDQTTYFQKEPVIITEKLGSDSEDDLLGTKTVFEEIPTFDVKSVKTVFESSGQTTGPIKHEKPQGDGKLLKKSQHSHKVKEGNKTSTQSMVYPEAINKQFALVDEFETEATGSRTSIQHSKMFSGIDSRHAPPTYEDVISGQILDISADNTPEELLKNFQKTWQESERVFRSLGYKISDTSETMWQEDVLQEHSALTENSGSYQGDLHSLSKDSISHGKSDSRQANLS
ncbi:xin actin-binding repeat-containing protein 2 isoform X2 [Heptranchias perlo]|uniref:xin actin-binding repeat-containing protein 2 isoform X2 n=1 Tax=Heptranchias perlo TaxID=212740 RepID=UPI00355A90AF